MNPNAPGIPRARLPAPSDYGDESERTLRHVKALGDRVGGMDLRLLALEESTRDLQAMVATVRSIMNQAFSKLVLIVLGAVGGTWGLGKATEPPPAPTTTVIQRSAFDRALDSCRALPSPDSQGECIARVVREQMGPRP